MIKRLRLKFIVINMGIATILLSAILGLVFYFTSANLETESIRMMERIASQPFQMNAPGELGEDVRLPFFTLQLGPHGELLDASGGYYDLSDDAFLGGLAQAAAASPRRLGVLEEYNLRYYRSDAPMSRFLVFADISSERATLDGLRRTCLLIGGLSFLAFLWGQRFALQVGGAPGGAGLAAAAAVRRGRLPRVENPADRHHDQRGAAPGRGGRGQAEHFFQQHPHHVPADARPDRADAGAGPHGQRRIPPRAPAGGSQRSDRPEPPAL